MIKKWAFAKIVLKEIPKNKGNQVITPAKIANTAPILKT